MKQPNKLAVHGGNAVGSLDLPSWPIYTDNELNSIKETLYSGNWGLMGAHEQRFAERFANYCGAKHAILVSNGSVSLKLALEALEIGPGDEVIVPGLTWQATASAVLEVNAVPILVDIDPDTYCISPKEIRASISSRTKCIIPVHLYCRVANLDQITTIAHEYGLYVIEDCAHQHGSEWSGAKVGTIGDIGSFSFQSSKILNAGEGGALITNNTAIAERLHALKNCGKPLRDDAQSMHGGNYRITEFQAAILNCQLDRLPEQNLTREENAKYIEENIREIQGLTPLERSEKINFQAYYALVLKYDPSRWGNISKEIFELCLKAELSYSLPPKISFYEPLNKSSLYQPQSKKTHLLSPEYLNAIKPENFHLPNAWRAYNQEAIVFFHTLLLGKKSDCNLLIEALHKLDKYKHRLSG